MIGGNPFLAPIEKMPTASKAVDIGCGTGVATVQIANALLSARVYGLDISSVPDAVQTIAPSNVSWILGNVMEVDNINPHNVMAQEIFTPCGIDYIFSRMLFLGINDWPRYFSTAYNSLKSGGIIEHQDLDWQFYRVGTSECLSESWEWHQAVLSGLEKSGLSACSGSDAPRLMKEAGFEIISSQAFEFSFVPSIKTPRSQAMGRYVQGELLKLYPELLRKMLGSQSIVGDELKRLTRESLHDICSEEGLHQRYTVTVARKL
jgi:SAM-dependent methyltransferase